MHENQGDYVVYTPYTLYCSQEVLEVVVLIYFTKPQKNCIGNHALASTIWD